MREIRKNRKPLRFLTSAEQKAIKRRHRKGPLVFSLRRMYTEAGWWDKPNFSVHDYDPLLCMSHKCESLILMNDRSLNKALEKAFSDAIRICLFRLTGQSVTRAYILRNFKDWLHGAYDECDGL